MTNKTPFVVISQQTNTPESMTLHRYEGKTHSGVLSFNTNEVASATEISNLAEQYRVLGNKIYENQDEPPTEPMAA